MPAWLLVLTFALPALGSVLALAAEAFGRPRTGVIVAMLVLVVSAGVSAVAATGEKVLVLGRLAAGGGHSSLTALMYLLTVLALLAGLRRLSGMEHGGQIAALASFSASAAAVMAGSKDLATLLVSLEAVALAGYALIAASRTRESDEAAMKYFVQGAVATGLLVYGLALVAGFGGATFYAELASTLSIGHRVPLAIGLVMLFSAIAFKLGAFPFHSWAPDAYETASPVVGAYLASVPKLAALLAAFLLFQGAFSSGSDVWMPVVLFVAVCSIVFGNLTGLRQVSYQRLLAYSGIAQVGYALVGFTAQRNMEPLIIFGVTYSIAAAGAFLFGEAVRETSDWDGSIASLAGVGRERPVLGASLAVCLLSLTGIPLTAGFWGKYLVFGMAVGQGVVSRSPWLLGLAVVGMVGSVVSFGYYGGVLKSVYLDEAPPREPTGRTGAATVAVLIAAGAVLVLGVAPFFAGLGWLLRIFG